jgi:transcriptional regulator with XRE-family HTH domain
MPKGVSRKAELAPKARELRAEGLKYREIAERLGVAPSTVDSWVNDPDLSKAAARRARYADACRDCGAPTDGSRGYDSAPERCRSCSREQEHELSRRWIIDSIQRWADEHGGVPPSAGDWNTRHEDGWPWTGSVQGIFGSFNAGIQAAGFEPTPVGFYGRPGEDPAFCEEIRSRYEAGVGSMRLAREYGCSRTAILYRVVKAGGRMRSHSESMEARRS